MNAIRQAGPGDLESLEGMAAAVGSRKESDYFTRCVAEQEAGSRLVLIVSTDGADAGYAMMNFQPRYSLYRKLRIPEIQDLNVVPALRRRGLATALIAHCENIARDKGCAHIGISVGLTADYGPAQRLYVKLGYVPDGNGVTYDRQAVAFGEFRPVDDDLCLMLVKDLF